MTPIGQISTLGASSYYRPQETSQPRAEAASDEGGVIGWLTDAYSALFMTGGIAGCGLVADAMAPDFSDADAGDPVCENYPGSFDQESPVDGAVDVSLSPTLDWTDSVDPDAGDEVVYRLELSFDDSFTSPTIYEGITASQFAVPDALAYEQTYYWRVVAIDLCAQETIGSVSSFTTLAEVVDPTCDTFPSDFVLESPLDDAINVGLYPNFDWSDSVDPDADDAVSYTLEVDEDNTFSDPLSYGPLAVSEFSMPDVLSNGQQYYWRVIAGDLCDQATTSPVFAFTTIEECAAFPGAFSLALPTDTAIDEPLLPTFEWTQSIDPDADDVVTYRLQIDTTNLFTSPDEFPGLTGTTYTLGVSDELLNDTTYYWRVIAEDACANEVYSTEIFSFTTLPSCTSTLYTDTDFLTGDLNQVENVTTPGSLTLDRNCTYRWDADSGLLPTLVVPPWTLTNPSGGTISLGTDPVTGDPALHTSSIGIDDLLRYELVPTFNNATGWVVEAKARLVDNSEVVASSNACGFDLGDGTRRAIIDIRNDRVIEVISDTWHMMDTITLPHVYNISGSGNNFFVNVDGAPAIDGTGLMTFGLLSTRFEWGDNSMTPDSEAYWYNLCAYDGGTQIPFYTSGTYERIFDLGTSVETIDTLAYNGNEPTDTSITFETRTGATAIPDGGWSSWASIVGGVIASPPAQWIQVRANLGTVSPLTVRPRLDDFTVDACN